MNALKQPVSLIHPVKKHDSWGEDMADAGKYMNTTLVTSYPRIHVGKCRNCGYNLDLYEMDLRRSSKTMRCERCGLLHYYKRDIVGKWRLQKAAKPELAAR